MSSSQIKIAFVNDIHDSKNNEDRNLRVDKIIIDSQLLESENEKIYSVGSWDSNVGCKGGNKKSEILYCNGYFQY